MLSGGFTPRGEVMPMPEPRRPAQLTPLVVAGSQFLVVIPRFTWTHPPNIAVAVNFGPMHGAPSQSQAPAPWKRLIVRGLAWGFGCGLAVFLVFLAVLFYAQRPKGWDARALRVKNAKAEGLSLMDEHLAEKSTGISFTVDLENTTGADITLPQTPHDEQRF